MLKVRKLADTSVGERVVRYDPETGERRLVNPATGRPEPWPLAGVRIEGDAPVSCKVPTSWVARGIAEGWLEGVNERPVVRPAGPTQNVWNSSHTGQPHLFMHYDALILKCVDGDVRYEVTHQPDKYVDSDDPSESVTPEIYAAGNTRVDHFYELTLAEG